MEEKIYLEANVCSTSQ